MTVQSTDLVIGVEEDLAVAILEYQGEAQLDRNPFVLALAYKVRLAPREKPSRLIVVVDDILKEQLPDKAEQLGWTLESLQEEIALEAIGDFLDQKGMPDLTPSGTQAVLVSGTAAAQRYFERRPEGSPADEVLLAYVARKVCWGWRHGLIETQLRPSDAWRLGTTLEDLVRVAIAGDGVYWQRDDPRSPSLVPTSRLLADVPSGAFPGIERPILPRVAGYLDAPRYDAAKQHFTRAMELLDQEALDLANAVKEAVAAVESLCLVVLHRDKGTLGDCIKDLRNQGLMKPQLAKAFESLWGFANEEPGVRHGKAAKSSVDRAEATFMLSLAASAIVLLLVLDQ